MLLPPTRLASNLLQIQTVSLTAIVERQMCHSLSSFRRLHSSAVPNQPSILGKLGKSQIISPISILQQSRSHLASPAIQRDLLRSFSSIRQKSAPFIQDTTSSRNAATLASPPPAEDESGRTPKPTRPIVAYHLFLCAAMVYLIIVVGGLTRLTESGLSITEWNPGFKGMKLPWTDAEWDAEWEKYKGTPEWAM